jgi:predicted SprT family Zn-dependent metalloprotease
MHSPTEIFYKQMQNAYAFFNKSLFSGQLPDCLITMQREKNVMGYFSANRWGNTQGEKTHEIALNPGYFGNHSLIELFQTLVHEQCHLWQHCAGKPGRRNYHNKEWAQKMESIGLMPSDTGMPGGKKTGEKMADYPVPGGLFLDSCNGLLKQSFELSWIDRKPAVTPSAQQRDITDEYPEIGMANTTPLSDIYPDLMTEETVRVAARSRQKTKYCCTGCDTNIWGKPDIRIICADCNKAFIQENPA